jgi:prepilin-type N-terminal cleavage/methylation domain-containing protein/prepilin-type processing-associated H-X9-DG protein
MVSRCGFSEQICPKAERGFTLVELLVVIGIIALLISILLPALNRARKSAITLKCASALREIGHAYEMYASDNRGWWPPIKLAPAQDASYSIDNMTYLAGSGGTVTKLTSTGTTPSYSITFPCYWYNFVSKYITRYQIGTGDTANGSNGQSQTSGANGSLFWGCPEWNGYTSNREDQMGYGANNYPTATANWPPLSTASAIPYPDSGSLGTTGHYHENTILTGWGDASAAVGGATGESATKNSPAGIAGDYVGQFYQQKDYHHPSERALVADSIFWQTISGYVSPTDIPACVPAANTLNNTQAPTGEALTWADFYRHGDYPKLLGTTSGGSGGGKGGGVASTSFSWDNGGGKVGYNILFCDGHVITSHSKSDAFLYFRMRYPG